MFVVGTEIVDRYFAACAGHRGIDVARKQYLAWLALVRRADWRMPADVKAALSAWGPGRYDARFNQDKESRAVLLPPAYGLRDVALETYTGEGPISYWNAYVAVTQMGGHGNFQDFFTRDVHHFVRTQQAQVPRFHQVTCHFPVHQVHHHAQFFLGP